ncbi:cupin domain-containing protein [Bradyrhizobium sp. TZ2]
MLKQSLLVSSVTAVLLLGGFVHAQQAPLQPSPVKRTPLGKVEVPGSNYEVVFGITELAPGFKSGRHSHPGLVLAYVAEGEFWYLVDGQPEKIYKVGESFQLPDSAIHNEGAAGRAIPSR